MCLAPLLNTEWTFFIQGSTGLHCSHEAPRPSTAYTVREVSWTCYECRTCFFSSSGPPGKRKSLYSSPVSRAFRGGSRQVPCIPCLSLQWCCEYYYSPFFQANVHQAVSSSPGAHIKFSIVSQHQDVLKPSTCLNISCSPWLIQNIFICFPMHCVFARVGHTLGVGVYLIKYSRVSHWGVPCDDPKWIECIPCHSTWNTFIVTSSLRVYVRPWSTPGVDVGYLSDRGTFISLGHTWSIYRVSMEHLIYSMLKGWRRRGRCHTGCIKKWYIAILA